VKRCWRIRGDDGARAIGATADAAVASTGGATGSSTTDRKFCSTDGGGAWSRSRSAELNDQQNSEELILIALYTRAHNSETRRPLTGPPLPKRFYNRVTVPTNGYASTSGLCKDSIIMQSRRPSNSDF
jgi:hypothetical protein